jgi:hypothetical protein
MAKVTKRRIDGNPSATSRTTPKGSSGDGGSKSSATSTRYTPPAHNVYRPSRMWVPVLMFTLFGIGFLAILLNYSEVLPSAPSGWYLITGLACILGGIITATQLH